MRNRNNYSKGLAKFLILMMTFTVGAGNAQARIFFTDESYPLEAETLIIDSNNNSSTQTLQFGNSGTTDATISYDAVTGMITTTPSGLGWSLNSGADATIDTGAADFIVTSNDWGVDNLGDLNANSLTSDNNLTLGNTVADGTAVDILAEQGGTGATGVLRYDGTADKWQIDNTGSAIYRDIATTSGTQSMGINDLTYNMASSGSFKFQDNGSDLFTVGSNGTITSEVGSTFNVAGTFQIGGTTLSSTATQIDTAVTDINNGFEGVYGNDSDSTLTIPDGDINAFTIADDATTPTNLLKFDTFNDKLIVDSTQTFVVENINLGANDGANKTLTINADNGGVGDGTLDLQAKTAITANAPNFSLDSLGNITNATWQGSTISAAYLDSDVIVSTEIDTEAELESLLGVNLITSVENNDAADDITDDDLGDLNDVTLTAPATGDILVKSATDWINLNDALTSGQVLTTTSPGTLGWSTQDFEAILAADLDNTITSTGTLFKIDQTANAVGNSNVQIFSKNNNTSGTGRITINADSNVQIAADTSDDNFSNLVSIRAQNAGLGTGSIQLTADDSVEFTTNNVLINSPGKLKIGSTYLDGTTSGASGAMLVGVYNGLLDNAATAVNVQEALDQLDNAISSPTISFEQVYNSDSSQDLNTANGNFEISTGTGDFSISSNDWSVNTTGLSTFPSTQWNFVTNTLNRPSGATLPATCTTGDKFYRTTDTTLFVCTSTNTWTAQTVTSTAYADGLGGTDDFVVGARGNSVSQILAGIIATNSGAGPADVFVASQDHVEIASWGSESIILSQGFPSSVPRFEVSGWGGVHTTPQAQRNITLIAQGTNADINITSGGETRIGDTFAVGHLSAFGAAGDTFQVSVNGSTGTAVPWNTNASTTALDIAADINSNVLGYSAVADSTVVIITADTAGPVGNGPVTVSIVNTSGTAKATTDDMRFGSSGGAVNINSSTLDIDGGTWSITSAGSGSGFTLLEANEVQIDSISLESTNGAGKIGANDTAFSNLSGSNVQSLFASVDSALTSVAEGTTEYWFDIGGGARNSAVLGTVASGKAPAIVFDEASDSSVTYSAIVPSDWANTNGTVTIFYSNTDSSDGGNIALKLDYGSFATNALINSFTNQVNTVTAGNIDALNSTSFTLSAATLAAGELLTIKLYRNPSDVADTHTHDISIHAIRLEI